MKEWNDKIQKENRTWNIEIIKKQLAEVNSIILQDLKEINEYKLSYFITDFENSKKIQSDISKILIKNNVKHHLILLKDYDTKIVYLDILPRGVNKLEALKFLMTMTKYDEVVFAGDSGNDLDILNSQIPSILVKNASDEVKNSIVSKLCYICSGNDNYNGNYSSGILEGLYYYGWIK